MSEWFRVMTYNVRYDNPDDGEHAWPNRRDAVASTIRFHGPQLLGLQEPLDHQIDDLRAQLPGFEWVGRPRVDGESEGEYAPIGYRTDRFTLKDTETFWLSETPEDVGSLGWDARHPRITTWARFEEPASGREFVHANTHFSHDGPKARIESARLLLERLTDLTTDEPVFVTGDFNCVTGEKPYEILVADREAHPTLTNATETSTYPYHGPMTSVTDFENRVPNRKIDHIFTTDAVDVRQHGTCNDIYAEDRYPSDHLPVLADVRLDGAT
jgi:endonuclease/exonuclease/phosphatase family metal-dependent hydrolase